MKKLLAVGIILLLVGVSIASSVAIVEKLYFTSTYIPHDPIYINGNNNFTSENGVTGGSGAYNDPYVIEDWDINAGSQDGITIRNTSLHFKIMNCYIHDGGIHNDGIVFINVINGVVEYVILTENHNGVMFRTQYTGKDNSEYNIIRYNNITSNTNDGIHFEHTGWGYHSHNIIYLNNITGNKQGIYMIMSAYNKILYNNIISNDEIGINLTKCIGGGQNNLVHHNNYVNNGDENGQACEWGGPLNYWDDGYPFGGNYWSDYNGVDNFSGPNQDIPGSDGIGDTPYVIPCYWCEGENNNDMYPLMEPFCNDTYPPKTFISFDPSEPDGDNDWYISNVTVTLDATDYLSEINASYYRINGGEWETYDFPFVIFEDRYYMIEYHSIDNAGNIEEVKSSKLYIDQTPSKTSLKWETRKISGKWYARFACNATDITSGLDRGEFYINEGLIETIIVSGSSYEFVFVIEWLDIFKTYEFKIIIYDIAGNSAFELVNGSDIDSHYSSQNINIQKSSNMRLPWRLESFSLLQLLPSILRWYIR